MVFVQQRCRLESFRFSFSSMMLASTKWLSLTSSYLTSETRPDWRVNRVEPPKRPSAPREPSGFDRAAVFPSRGPPLSTGPLANAPTLPHLAGKCADRVPCIVLESLKSLPLSPPHLSFPRYLPRPLCRYVLPCRLSYSSEASVS